MPLRIRVTGDDRPRSLIVDDEKYDVQQVLNRWRETSLVLFKVATTQGQLFVTRHDEETDEWGLCADFDGAAFVSKPELIAYSAPVATRRSGRFLKDRHSLAVDVVIRTPCGS